MKRHWGHRQIVLLAAWTMAFVMAVMPMLHGLSHPPDVHGARADVFAVGHSHSDHGHHHSHDVVEVDSDPLPAWSNTDEAERQAAAHHGAADHEHSPMFLLGRDPLPEGLTQPLARLGPSTHLAGRGYDGLRRPPRRG
ncbi:hypothetical protein [Phaeobacter sp.]|uniref:hypothetical protein n=1 Tax=Phaeobacter sp. TaxID=1902409 RepID=UPI0025E99F5C|nr:hypothetical protein [Phaeobacter sp.]